jgi:NAD(P)-dependent dehydrogenase (short-subunit alcohol dehydrogenase family)
MKNNERVILITGASSGIGLACALYLSKKGYRVFGTSRHFPSPDFLETNGQFFTVRMNVTIEGSVNKAVEAILRKTGRIDVLINNAGFGLAGAIEDTLTEETQKQFLTNFFGVHIVTRAVLPVMKKQNSGYIINISSLAALIPLPFQAFYSATKSALELMTETLGMELKSVGSNIKVVLIQPNDYCTKFTENRQKVALWEKSSYLKRAEKALEVAENGERNGPPPIQVARLVEKIINKKNPKLYYPVGSNARLLALARKILPAKILQKLVMKYFGI